MKKNNVLKVAFMVIGIILIFTNISYGATSIPPKFNENASFSGNAKLTEFGAIIATVIRNVGIIVAVILLMILGIKYMMGSTEERASYKKSAIPYLVGAVLLFGAAGIAQIVVNIAKDL